MLMTAVTGIDDRDAWNAWKRLTERLLLDDALHRYLRSSRSYGLYQKHFHPLKAELEAAGENPRT